MKNVHKLGKSRAGEGSRIWLEGERLKACGMKYGTLFTRFISRADKWMVIEKVTKAEWEKLKRDQRGTVAGAPDRPIIDITGSIVIEAFMGFEFVEVTYAANKITIRGVKS